MAKKTITKQQDFYCKCFADPRSGTWHNQGKSALKAGYSKECADQQASVLMKKTKILARIDVLEEKFYINTRETSEEEVVANYVHDRELARKNNQAQAAINATTKLGEIGGRFKQRAIIEIKPVNIPGSVSVDESVAYAAAGAAYKEIQATDGGNGYVNPVRPTTAEPAEALPVEALPSKPVKTLSPQECEIRERKARSHPLKVSDEGYDVVSDRGAMPNRKPRTSRSNFS